MDTSINSIKAMTARQNVTNKQSIRAVCEPFGAAGFECFSGFIEVR